LAARSFAGQKQGTMKGMKRMKGFGRRETAPPLPQRDALRLEALTRSWTE
jgi:hypothetical protein